MHRKFREHAGEFCLMEEVHEQGLDLIIAMVSKGDSGEVCFPGHFEEEGASVSGAGVALDGGAWLLGLYF